jgi:Fe-S-cluster containining protein
LGPLQTDFNPLRIPDCKSCQDNCCRAPNERSLRMVDILVLEEAGLGDAIVPPPSSREREDVHRAHPGLKAAESLTSFRRFPVLAQKDGRCIFLDSNERCEIYNLRPLVCRGFPVQVDQENAQLTWSGRCQSFTEAVTIQEVERANTLKADAQAHFSAKGDDLVMLGHGKKQLQALALARHIHQPPLDDGFARVLAQKGQGRLRS